MEKFDRYLSVGSIVCSKPGKQDSIYQGGTGQITLTQDVVTTAGHNFVDDRCQPLGTQWNCRFTTHFGSYAIDFKQSRFGFSLHPRDWKDQTAKRCKANQSDFVKDDWAILKLTEKVKDAVPFPIYEMRRDDVNKVGPPVEMIAGYTKAFLKDGRPAMSIERCRQQGASPRGGSALLPLLIADCGGGPGTSGSGLYRSDQGGAGVKQLIGIYHGPLILPDRRISLYVPLGGEFLTQLKLVASQADTVADGKAAFLRGDYATALQLLQPAAEQGDAEAQNVLGVMNDAGKGVPRDVAAALALYRRAAEQGHVKAQHNLGVMYDQGRGTPKDEIQAVSWYRMAAERGLAWAQNNLGLMYRQGRGVPQDDAQALAWYRKAADQGLAAAQYNIGLVYADGQGSPRGFDQAIADFRQAVAWYRKAAEQGYAKAQYHLGLMYEIARGVPQDPDQAYLWYRLATRHAAGSSDREMAEANLQRVAKTMSPEQIALAEQKAAAWAPTPKASERAQLR